VIVRAFSLVNKLPKVDESSFRSLPIIDPLPAGPQISDGKIEPNPNLGKKGKGTSNRKKNRQK
jgi:hypothetical protein